MKIEDIRKAHRRGIQEILLTKQSAIALQKEFQDQIDKEYEERLEKSIINYAPEKRIMGPITSGCFIYGVRITIKD